jgi:hypothetical protein
MCAGRFTKTAKKKVISPFAQLCAIPIRDGKESRRAATPCRRHRQPASAKDCRPTAFAIVATAFRSQLRQEANHQEKRAGVGNMPKLYEYFGLIVLNNSIRPERITRRLK